MPVRRKALIITNAGVLGSENYCKGVFVDSKNYKAFLVSAPGGAWLPSEIDCLDRPTAKSIKDWISQNAETEYVFIAFSGHGYYSTTNNDHALELNTSEILLSNELARGTHRRTIILDCCQMPHQERLVATAKSFAFLESFGRQASAERCRRLFSEEVMRSPAGLIKIVSCTIGETAGDDDVRGGRYTGSLFEHINSWTRKQQSSTSSMSGSLSIVAAHDNASVMTKNLSGGKQNPTITKPRSSPYFPIAVFS